MEYFIVFVIIAAGLLFLWTLRKSKNNDSAIGNRICDPPPRYPDDVFKPSSVNDKPLGYPPYNRVDDSSYSELPPKQYWDDTTSVPVSAKLNIEYIKANGQQSNRIIQTSWYDGSSYLNAFCELRQQRRTFRIERIVGCIDVDSGEVVNDIPQHLLNKYHNSPGYILSLAIDKLSDILMVLYYVGKADGQLRAAERAILLAVVRKVVKDDRISDEMINRAFDGAGVPSLQAIKLAINRICKTSHRNMATTYKIAQLIVNTQKTVHPSEAEILEYMQRKMKKEGISSDKLAGFGDGGEPK